MKTDSAFIPLTFHSGGSLSIGGIVSDPKSQKISTIFFQSKGPPSHMRDVLSQIAKDYMDNAHEKALQHSLFGNLSGGVQFDYAPMDFVAYAFSHPFFHQRDIGFHFPDCSLNKQYHPS